MGNGFGILFMFKIDNEKSGIMICQHLTLINNTESFLLIKNLVKSKAWLLLDYDGVSYLVLGNKFIDEIYCISLSFTKTTREKELINSWWWSLVFKTLKHFWAYESPFLS